MEKCERISKSIKKNINVLSKYANGDVRVHNLIFSRLDGNTKGLQKYSNMFDDKFTERMIGKSLSINLGRTFCKARKMNGEIVFSEFRMFDEDMKKFYEKKQEELRKIHEELNSYINTKFMKLSFLKYKDIESEFSDAEKELLKEMI